MKLALALCIASAAAVAPPRIELDLPQLHVGDLIKHVDIGGTGTWDRHHTIHGSNRRGVHDYTERCPAGSESNADSCPLPVAHAWDSMKGDLKVTTSIYLVDDNGHTYDKGKKVTEVEYNKRRMYLLKYDATDGSGNKAQQLVFALVLDDTKPPAISCDSWAEDGVTCDCRDEAKISLGCKERCTRSGVDFIIEAAAGFQPQSLTPKKNWELCKDWSAFDLVQGSVDSTIKYEVSAASGTNNKVEYSGPSWAEANKALTTTAGDSPQPLGHYILRVTAHDDAGSYGAENSDNSVVQQISFLFEDNQSPIITIDGTSPSFTIECGEPYVDEGAFANDARDGLIELNKDYTADPYTNEAQLLESFSNVESDVEGAYNVTYTVIDAANNRDMKQRFVLVKDSKAPMVDLVGSPTVTRYVQKNNVDRIEEPGVAAHDLCDKSLNAQVFTQPQEGGPTSPKVTMTWSKNSAGQDPDSHPKVTGTFTRTYTVWDTTSNGKFNSTTRDFVFVDDEEPWVELNGKAVEVLVACDPDSLYPQEWQNDDKYENVKQACEWTDQSAKCFDYVGGELSDEQLTVVVNNVDRTKPGNYTVTYKCHDNSDPPNESEEVSRTVIVRDTGCPTIVLAGEYPTMHVEANFPFEDPGAHAEDHLDGTITWESGKISTIGDTVNVRNSFVEARSCAQLVGASKLGSPKNGDYTITLFTAKKGFFRQRVFCDFSVTPARTFMVNQAEGTNVVPYSTSEGNCLSHGMVMAALPLSSAAMTRWAKLMHIWTLNTENPTNIYICEAVSTNSIAATAHQATMAALGGTGAEPGTYKISYHYTDSSNLSESDCGAVTNNVRSVIVRDTLAPVISLHMKDKLMTSSNPSAAEGSPANPAWDSKTNPFLTDGYFDVHALAKGVSKSLMAEESSTPLNGWVIAALASALAGVALLASTYRRTSSVAISVPV